MSEFELALTVWARLKAKRNGHVESRLVRAQGYAINAINAESPPRYVVVRDGTGLATLAAALEETAVVSLDLETTGLDPRSDRVRLLSLSLDTSDGGVFAYLVDCFAVDPCPLFLTLAEKDLVIHHGAFDLAF